jgi:hypothetical protein
MNRCDVKSGRTVCRDQQSFEHGERCEHWASHPRRKCFLSGVCAFYVNAGYWSSLAAIRAAIEAEAKVEK